jgi:membrane associated rhomboid family serine protease
MARRGCGRKLADALAPHVLIIPLYDHPRPRNFIPILVVALIIANVWVHVALHVVLGFDGGAWGQFYRAWGFVPALPMLTTAFTSMFLHGDVLHLAGNLLFLWVFGDNVEHGLGRGGFLLTYVLGGLAGSAMYLLLSLGSEIPTIGASGAVSAVLGAYLVLYPGNRVMVGWLFWFLVFVRYGRTPLPAIVVLGFYFLYDNLLPVVLGLETGVAFGAHIGGFLFGMAAAAGIRALGGLTADR